MCFNFQEDIDQAPEETRSEYWTSIAITFSPPLHKSSVQRWKKITLCVFFPELYKEYRHLKQTKENNGSDKASTHTQSKSTDEVDTGQKVLNKDVCYCVCVHMCFYV